MEGSSVESNGSAFAHELFFEFIPDYSYRTDSLSTQYKNNGQRPRWSPTDAYILVRKYVVKDDFPHQHYSRLPRIDSLNVRDDTEIDWKTLLDEHWDDWSAHSLQRRWVTMKRGIKGYEEMSHAGRYHHIKLETALTLKPNIEIMEILRTKKAQEPPQVMYLWAPY